MRDCEVLLRIRDKISGEEVFLNWGATVPITQWEGVWVNLGSDSPPRVENLFFATELALRGIIPPEIGELTGLTLSLYP